jgi:hypothetical protein
MHEQSSNSILAAGDQNTLLLIYSIFEVIVQDNQDKYHIAESYKHTVAMELLFARLKEYGLEVVSHKPERVYSTDAKLTFVLRRVVSRRK